MPAFVKLGVDTGSGIIYVEMPVATTLRYAALRMADHLGLNTEENRYFLMEPRTLRQHDGDALAADYADVVFVLGSETL